MVLYQKALQKGLQAYIQADRFAPCRWTAPGVPPVFTEDTKDEDPLFGAENVTKDTKIDDVDDDFDMSSVIEDGEIEGDMSS